MMKRIAGLLLATFMAIPVFAQGISGARQTCDSGEAAGFECLKVDMISWMQRYQLTVDPVQTDPFGNIIQPAFELNDMWGWKHEESQRSFLIVGRTDGTSFVEVTDPFNPVFLGELPSSFTDAFGNPIPSGWRDMKVYANHAYIVADGAPGHGMQVFDLTQLLTVTEPEVFDLTNHYVQVSSVHNIVINEETGFGYAVGMNAGGKTCAQGMHMIDLSVPNDPQFAGCFAELGTSRLGGGYTHDAHCVVYHGPDPDWLEKEICVNANEQSIVLADVTDKDNPTAISIGHYPATAYAHQGWLSEDHRYFFLGDELDEVVRQLDGTYSYTGATSRTLIWDLTDLDEPELATEFSSGRLTIDHNMYVRGHLLFQSQYNDGLRILDISDPVNPVEVGFFDTHPSDITVWEGSWSNYPYLDDTMVAATSSVDGLFILQPDASITTTVARGGELPQVVGLMDVYPNPFQGQSMLEFEMTRTESVRIELLDLLGRSIRTLFEGNVHAGQVMRQTIPGDGLSAGTYVVRVQGSSFETTRRLVKMQ